MKKIIAFLSLFILSLSLLFACGPKDSGDGSTDGDTGYKVTLITNEGARVEGENPITVSEGENAVFTVNLDSQCVFRSAKAAGADVGFFDYKTGKYTVGNVISDMRIEFTVENVGYNTTVGYNFNMRGTSSDKASHANSNFQAGTRITVTAGLETSNFVGWSIGGYISDGGKFVSAERVYTFDLKGNTIIFANYADSNVMYYDLNGGKVNANSKNMSNKDYYLATLDGTLVKVAIKQSYLDYLGCASTFWDDGSFTREGYVLTEYNTKPDGSGEGFGLGSKFPMNLESTTLYCIWTKDSEHSDFEYEDYTFARPDGVKAANSPDWNENGVIINKYLGDDTTVAIPETLGGKPVIAIAENAFMHKDMETLVLNKNILKIEDGAFLGCTKLATIYYPDGIYSVSDAALDDASYTSLHNFYVNATIAPRYSNGDAAFAMKFTRLLANSDKNRIIVIAGSSAYQGLSSAYLEALLGGEYCVVNFGTTRTTHGTLYLEATQYYAHEGDVILYAPENSAYMMGEPTLYWKTLRDIEGMYNVFRHIDIANYKNIFGAFAEVNAGSAEGSADPCTSPRYQRTARTYEEIASSSAMNEYGEYQNSKRQSYYNADNYKDRYVITLNNRFKSSLEGPWLDVDAEQNAGYNDPSNSAWCSIDDARYKDVMNHAINSAKSSGAKVYFSFSPVDAMALCHEAKASPDEWLSAYEAFIADTYDFDGILGECKSYVFAREYFYDCAFHPNDYGRTYRTYQIYRDLCSIFGVSSVKGILDVGIDFEGCLFENTSDGVPRFPAY